MLPRLRLLPPLLLLLALLRALRGVAGRSRGRARHHVVRLLAASVSRAGPRPRLVMLTLRALLAAAAGAQLAPAVAVVVFVI